MTKGMFFAIAPVLAVLPGAVLADSASRSGDGFGHMMWGGGFGMAGGLMMLLFWGAIIALIVFAVRGFSAKRGSGGQPDAGEILRQRYAKGEIDDDEYERRKAKLESSNRDLFRDTDDNGVEMNIPR